MKETEIGAQSRLTGPPSISCPEDFELPNYALISYIVVSLTFRLSKPPTSSDGYAVLGVSSHLQNG
ncbi:MAG: hypothetical protein METHAR1v1_1610010 [Methanothrix sp.]|nr:MAG: hypothetical protein METHAR1v1_1610010 [Methanothrix sp.]